MTDRPTPTQRPDAAHYEIRLAGHLDARWATWFDGLTVSRQVDGITVLSGRIADQAALHGVLQRVRDLGLPLVAVTRLDPAAPEATGRVAGPTRSPRSTAR